MEKKQKKPLQASAVFGAFFVLFIIICWVFTVREIRFKEYDFFIPQNETSVLLLVALQLLMVIIVFSLAFNIIGWVTGSNRYIFIAGILYALSLNLVPAFLCLRVYLKEKRKIKNRLLFYTMICTFILSALIIALSILGSKSESEETFKEMLPFWIYFISTISFGIIFNFIAWKTGNNITKVIAGIAYILGLFTVIPAIMCLVSGRDFLKAIKNKLLFYAMVFALAWIVILIVVVIVDSEKDAILPFWIYMISMGIAGLFINYFARKTNNKKAKIIAGLVYIVGTINLLSAILCFISCKDNRKLPNVDEKAANRIDVKAKE